MLLSCIRSSNHSALAVLFARRTSLCISASFSSAANANDDADADGNNEVYVLQSTSRGEIGKSQLQSQTIPPKQPTSTRRRTRRRTALGQGSNGASSIPSLADFMHRAKVLNQYRNFVRLAQFVDGKDSNSTADGTGDTTTSGECRAALEEVRLSFKMGMKKDVDSLSKTMAFSQGERRLRELEAMVGYSAKKQSSKASTNEISPESHDSDSWINIQDEEDPRGRVGVKWPWEVKDGETSK